MRNLRLAALGLVLLVPARGLAQFELGAGRKIEHYSPPSHNFDCDIPVGWQPFEELDEYGSVVHILGPESASQDYRAGFDIRWNEKGDPGYQPWKKALEEIRRSDDHLSRGSSIISVFRAGGVMVRAVEITETRRLPPDRFVAVPEELHRYYAFLPVPGGESYFTISLASSRDSYQEYRDIFLQFLKDFKPIGYK